MSNSVNNIVSKLMESHKYIRESKENEYINVEYTYNGDDLSDYLGHVKVRTDSKATAIKSAEKYAMQKHPEAEPRHFTISDDDYTNVDVVDIEGKIVHSDELRESNIKFHNAGAEWEILDKKGEYTLVYSEDRKFTPYVVAWLLDLNTGSWAQGYYFREEENARKFLAEQEGDLDEAEGEDTSYEEFKKACMSNSTWKKANAVCEKYGYKLSPTSCVTVYPSGKKYPEVRIMVDYSKEYYPEIYYYAGKFGKDDPTMEIQTTAYGSLPLEKHAEFIEAVTNAHNLVDELSKIDFTTLYEAPAD